jgi:uncharacterized protein YfiM (DUF2279 family)
MKSLIVAAALIFAVTGFFDGAAHAAGCLKGAVVGGVAGHYAEHHGVLGAGAGCLIGRHEADKRAREQLAQDRRYETGYRSR